MAEAPARLVTRPDRVRPDETSKKLTVRYFYPGTEGSQPRFNIIAVKDSQDDFEAVFEVEDKEKDIRHKSKPFPKAVRDQFKMIKEGTVKKKREGMLQFKIEFEKFEKSKKFTLGQYFEV